MNPAIWLGKILEDDICFAKFNKVSPARILCYMVHWPRCGRIVIVYKIDTFNAGMFMCPIFL